MKGTWKSRLFSHCEIQPNGCWLWTGATERNGYGLFTGPAGHPVAKMTVAHRWSYYAMRGPIPDGMELDHLCNVRGCINPAHLEPVTKAENARRRSERQTHCKWGHEFTPENTRIKAGTQNHRICRICHRRNSSKTQAKTREVTA